MLQILIFPKFSLNYNWRGLLLFLFKDLQLLEKYIVRAWKEKIDAAGAPAFKK